MKTVPCTRMFLILLCSAFLPTVQAQNITATINKIDHDSYAGVASQFALTDLKVDGKTIYNGSGYLFCADYEGTSLDQDNETYPRIVSSLQVGTMEQMEVWNRFGNTQDESLSRAMAHWFIDNYYEASFLQPENNTNARQYAFQNVLWEIFGDGGTTAGLNFNSGNIDRSNFNSKSSSTMWGYMTTMLDAVKNSGVTSSYQEKYEVLAALDSRADHQDYLMLAASPSAMVVPEPSALLLALAGSVLLMRRRRD